VVESFDAPHENGPAADRAFETHDARRKWEPEKPDRKMQGRERRRKEAEQTWLAAAEPAEGAATPYARQKGLTTKMHVNRSHRPGIARISTGNPVVRTGLRIHGERGDPCVRDSLIRYARWLRSNFAFPVRVPVYLKPGDQFVTAEGENAVSSFFAPFDRGQEPYIRIATGDYQSLKKEIGRDNALASFIASLNRQLIHYWQWTKTRTVWEAGVAKQAVAMLRKYQTVAERP
jgi:hypothetical protein